jgi:pimeloyl-ACP methyl ester carboxylesterase
MGLGLVSCGPRLPIPAKLLENAANPTTFPFAAQSFTQLVCSARTHPRLVEQSHKRLSALRQTLLYGDLLACDKFDVTGSLDRIKMPVLVTCGTDDKLVPPRFSSVLAASIPGAALQTVDGAGHLVQLEQPHRMAKLLSVFLQTIPFTLGS